MKVAFEMCLMAANAGLVHTDAHVMCIAGSGRGGYGCGDEICQRTGFHRPAGG
jgi:hypothetical protein